MDPGPEGKLYSEDYDEDYDDELDSGNWMASYDSARNGKEALTSAGWPDNGTNDGLVSLFKNQASSSLISCDPHSSWTHLHFYFSLASLSFLPLLFGFWSSNTVVTDFGVWG